MSSALIVRASGFLIPYLDRHVKLLLVRCQVVALSQEDLPEGSFSQLPLQYDVVSLDVLDNFSADKIKLLSRSGVHLDYLVDIKCLSSADLVYNASVIVLY